MQVIFHLYKRISTKDILFRIQPPCSSRSILLFCLHVRPPLRTKTFLVPTRMQGKVGRAAVDWWIVWVDYFLERTANYVYLHKRLGTKYIMFPIQSPRSSQSIHFFCLYVRTPFWYPHRCRAVLDAVCYMHWKTQVC